VFTKSAKPLQGRGWGTRFPLARKTFYFFLHLFSAGLRPKTILVEVGGIKLYLNSKSTFAPDLMVTGTYDKGTTRLIKDLIKPGMVILDIGANVGYYSLIAAQLVGEKGKVFAFEPAPDNFAFLTKNIEVNGFGNIIPVPKGVSNKSGKGSLFLLDAPDEHTMREHNEKRATEVEVTSVDEFMGNINRPVDLIKMDVEGSEMRVLEGTVETIRRNPELKIITEFSPHYLQRSGSSPEAFLKKFTDCGFKLYIINEETGEIKLADAGSIMKARRRPGLNLYCDRE
jgi:FkbM family methyltransferase